MKQGEIILIPFPFTDLSSKKTRPALIVSKQNSAQGIIAVAITSKESASCVKIDDESLIEGKLPIISYVRHDKVVTLHKSLVIKVVAQLKDNVLGEVVQKFKTQF